MVCMVAGIFGWCERKWVEQWQRKGSGEETLVGKPIAGEPIAGEPIAGGEISRCFFFRIDNRKEIT